MKITLIALMVVGLTHMHYNEMLDRLHQKQRTFKLMEENERFSQASQILYATLKDSIFEAWYGTEWDFNGTTNIPQEGEIACGYFVSTTLKHAGFNLNRYKIAQQDSRTIINVICGRENVTTKTSKNALINALSERQDGLYILGLSYHVGYILIENQEIYFVHADFFSDQVIKEKLTESKAINTSSIFVFGEVTNNRKLINAWLNQEKLY